MIVLVVLGLLLFLNPNFKTIAAGVSILLFGMITLEEGFKVFTKGPLKSILGKATDKLYKSISLGASGYGIYSVELSGVCDNDIIH